MEKNITITDILTNLDLGDYSDSLNDYRGDDSYICDAITEIADNNTSIYYSDIIDYISQHVEDVADAIDEFGWDGVGRDLYKAGQVAEMRSIESDISEHIEDAIVMVAVNVLVYDHNITELPESTWLAIEERLHDIDDNNMFSDIDDVINDIIGEEM